MKRKIGYDFIFLVSLFHAGAITALFYFELRWLLLALGVWIMSHGLGLAVGYHRLLTHRGFKTPKLVEYLITICGNLALQGGHIKWIAIHRQHHKYTDEAGDDPHTPRDGFFYSHIGWMIKCDPETNTIAYLEKYAPDLYKDPIHRFLNKYWWLTSTSFGLSLWYFFGLPAMLWGVFVPVGFGLQFTWMVNSVCHRFGSRMFNTNDDSRNHWLVALLTWGEGWHNNHHAQPSRARHGLKWYQFDPSWIIINVLKLFGLARDIRQ